MFILRKVYKFVIKLLLGEQKVLFHVEYGKGERKPNRLNMTYRDRN